MTTKEKFEEIKKKVSDKCLFIGRIPKKTKLEFLELAKEEFEDDFGFTLKWLLDFRKGLLSDPNQVLIEQIEIMAKEIEQLKAVPQEKKKVIHSVGGTKITEKVIKDE